MPVRIVSAGGGGVTLSAASTGSEFTATLPANTGTVVTTASSAAVTPAMLTQPLTLATAQASTSGTAIDFTGIPSWARRITVMFSGVSTNGSSTISVQLGTSSGIDATGYASGGVSSVGGSNNVGATSTTRFLTQGGGGATDITHGIATISLVGSNLWVFSFVGAQSQAGNSLQAGGSKTLAGTLDRVRITTVNGTDVFDAGSINILYEG